MKINKIIILLTLLIITTFAVYYNSFKVPFVLDDLAKIVNNPDIKELKNIKTKLIYPYEREFQFVGRNDPSRPLTYLTFTLNYYFGKLNTFGYHLINLLLHIFNVILIFLLTRKIIFYIQKKSALIIPFFTALLFAVHPINTEVVTYIYHRSGSLASLFFLLSVILFLKSLEKKKFLYFFSLLCFILALSAKQIAIVLPLILLIIDFLFLSEYKLAGVLKKKLYHLPFWLILIGYLLFRWLYLGYLGDTEVNANILYSSFSYFLIQLSVIFKYLGLLLLPIAHSVDHYIEPIKSISDTKVILPSISLIGLIILAYWMVKKRNKTGLVMLCSLLWFIIILSVTSSIFPNQIPMAERRVYLPSFGFYFLLVFCYFSFFNKSRFWQQKTGRSTVIILLIIYCSFLGFLTVQRNQLYQSPILLWEETVNLYPNNFKAHLNLGVYYAQQKNFNGAISEFQKAIILRPNLSTSHFNLGKAYQDIGKYEQAIEQYQKTLELNPNHPGAINNLNIIDSL